MITFSVTQLIFTKNFSFVTRSTEEIFILYYIIIIRILLLISFLSPFTKKNRSDRE